MTPLHKELRFSLYHFPTDPANQQLLNSGLAHPDGGGKLMGTPGDNYGGLGASLTSLTFSNGQTTGSAYLTVNQAHAGNNWIVGVSPNLGILDDWTQVNESGSKNSLVLKPVTNRTYTPGILRQTPVLTVWRTLWVELDQMANPTEGTGPNQFSVKAGDQPDLHAGDSPPDAGAHRLEDAVGGKGRDGGTNGDNR